MGKNLAKMTVRSVSATIMFIFLYKFVVVVHLLKNCHSCNHVAKCNVVYLLPYPCISLQDCCLRPLGNGRLLTPAFFSILIILFLFLFFFLLLCVGSGMMLAHDIILYRMETLPCMFVNSPIYLLKHCALLGIGQCSIQKGKRGAGAIISYFAVGVVRRGLVLRVWIIFSQSTNGLPCPAEGWCLSLIIKS